MLAIERRNEILEKLQTDRRVVAVSYTHLKNLQLVLNKQNWVHDLLIGKFFQTFI